MIHPVLKQDLPHWGHWL